MTWNVDPIFIAIGGMQIRWYGLMFATAFIVSHQTVKWIYLREGKNVEKIDRLAVYLFAGTLVGARLGHCLLYNPSYYLNNPLQIFALSGGGLASHGGGLGVLLALYLYQKKEQESYLWLLDRIAIPMALAGFFIRIGNLFNSEILGVPASIPWAVIFARIDAVPRHPAQVYEGLAYLLIFFLLMLFYRWGMRKTNDGVISGLFLVSVFIARFFIEFVKAKQEAYSSEFWMSTGQLLSIPFAMVGAVLILMALRGSKRISPASNRSRGCQRG